MTDDPRSVFRQPRNTMPKIKQITMFLSVDPEDGNEGACATMVNGVWMPLIAADELRVPWCREQAKIIAMQTGVVVREVTFTVRTDVAEIKP